MLAVEPMLAGGWEETVAAMSAHEAGHLVVAHHLGHTLERARAFQIPDGARSFSNRFAPGSDLDLLVTADQRRDVAIRLLAGDLGARIACSKDVTLVGVPLDTRAIARGTAAKSLLHELMSSGTEHVEKMDVTKALTFALRERDPERWLLRCHTAARAILEARAEAVQHAARIYENAFAAFAKDHLAQEWPIDRDALLTAAAIT